MTFEEYRLRNTACELRKLDDLANQMEVAWSKRAINATDKNGVYIAKKLDEVFDFKKTESILTGEKAAAQSERVEELVNRSERAKRAEEIAKQRLAERRGTDATK